MDTDLICRVVWSFIRKYPDLEFDELFAEACLAWLEAAPRFDPNKGRRSTYFWHVISNRLTSLLRIRHSRGDREILTNDAGPLGSSPSPEDELIKQESWREMIDQLSPEGRLICEMVFSEELDLPISRPRSCRGIIARALKDRGWSWGSIWGGFREIQKALASPR